MKKLVIIALGLLIASCGTIKKVEIEHRIETHYIDSTIWHTDTAYFDIPREVYKDYTSLLDTLKLETGVAKSWAAIDTNKMMLTGEIENKPVKLEKEIQWKEKIVYKDSLVYKEIPVEVEVIKEKVPNWSWWTLGICVALLGVGVVKLKNRLF